MMRANVRVPAPRGAAAHAELGGQLRCDRQAEEMLKVFFPEVSDGQLLPPELKGLTDGAHSGAACNPPPQDVRVMVRRGTPHAEHNRVAIATINNTDAGGSNK